MAARLATATRDRPVLALLGNMHVLKHVEWEPGVGDAPPAAELLVGRKGLGLVSAPELVGGVCEQRESVLRKPDQPESRVAIGEVFVPMAAQMPDDPESVADKVIVWGCR
jgi:hypothetical protein